MEKEEAESIPFLLFRHSAETCIPLTLRLRFHDFFHNLPFAPKISPALWIIVKKDGLPLIKERRVEIILAELKHRGIVTVDELAEKINTSRSTIRRDIDELEEQGALKRIRGGAVAVQSSATSHEPPFMIRQDMFLDEKVRIAQAASSLVKPNETLFISCGTTLHEFAKALQNANPPLYVATNDLMIAMDLAQHSQIELMVIGGSLRHNHFSLNGFFAENAITQIHADKAFIGVDAIDFNIGFMNFSIEEIQAKKLMLQASKEIIVLCDHSKFEKVAFVNICGFEEIDILITGRETPPAIIAKLEDAGVKVLTV